MDLGGPALCTIGLHNASCKVWSGSKVQAMKEAELLLLIIFMFLPISCAKLGAKLILGESMTTVMMKQKCFKHANNGINDNIVYTLTNT